MSSMISSLVISGLCLRTSLTSPSKSYISSPITKDTIHRILACGDKRSSLRESNVRRFCLRDRQLNLQDGEAELSSISRDDVLAIDLNIRNLRLADKPLLEKLCHVYGRVYRLTP